MCVCMDNCKFSGLLEWYGHWTHSPQDPLHFTSWIKTQLKNSCLLASISTAHETLDLNALKNETFGH